MLVRELESEWLELVTDLVQAPLDDLPVEPVANALNRSLGAVGCAYSEVRDGMVGGEIYPRTAPLNGHRCAIEEWGADNAYRAHPLLIHYRATGSVPLMQIADVPSTTVDARAWDEWIAVTGPWGCAEQVALPLSADPVAPRAFVVARDRPFSAREMAAAVRIRRLVVGLDRQVRAMAGRRPEPAAALDARITPRELAVLALLGDGLTAAAIARRLEIGERTVHKHLEHVYAKLRVTDRLSAVVRARDAGLIRAASSGAASGVGSPVR
jgi:DNA-binding CsgD family transcriptional regulator